MSVCCNKPCQASLQHKTHWILSCIGSLVQMFGVLEGHPQAQLPSGMTSIVANHSINIHPGSTAKLCTITVSVAAHVPASTFDWNQRVIHHATNKPASTLKTVHELTKSMASTGIKVVGQRARPGILANWSRRMVSVWWPFQMHLFLKLRVLCMLVDAYFSCVMPFAFGRSRFT